MLDALDVRTGELLWSYNTQQEYSPVNEDGTVTTGGAFDGHGPQLIDDLLVIPSGYGTFGQRGGNALLVFQVGGGNE